jgi:hypothetical protein
MEQYLYVTTIATIILTSYGLGILSHRIWLLVVSKRATAASDRGG